MLTAIISAIPEENNHLIRDLGAHQKHHHANRTFYQGKLYGQDVILVASHWGKVAAALTTTLLCQIFKADKIIFLGAAGAIQNDLHVGDIIVAKDIIQHDIDARPFFGQNELPFLGKACLETDKALTENLFNASQNFVSNNFKQINANLLKQFKIKNPKVVQGTIVSGDQFITDLQQLNHITQNKKDALCVEMEGAAVAQVCNDYRTTFAVARVISDRIQDGNSASDFFDFIGSVVSEYVKGIAKSLWLK